jgi:hypothetical protein
MRVVTAIGILAIGLTTGCSRPAESAPALRSGGPNVPGREVRYNAVLALAHRGSPRIKEEGVWDVLLEMLDEDQQLQNYTPRTGNSRGVADETAARTTVISGLEAVQELHRKLPQLELSGLREPIEKLSHSSNATVSVQARRTLEALFPPKPG